MEGQARVAGKIYKDVQIGDKTYRLSRPALVGIYGEIEAFIVSRKVDPLVVAVRACKIAPLDMHGMIWDAAMRAASSARIATREEMDTFWQSRWANAFLFWKALDPRHAEEVPDIEAAMKIMETSADLQMDELLANIKVVNGEDDVKNSHGPSTTRAASQQTETQPTVDGQESTDTSPKNTDGPPMS